MMMPMVKMVARIIVVGAVIVITAVIIIVIIIIIVIVLGTSTLTLATGRSGSWLWSRECRRRRTRTPGRNGGWVLAWIVTRNITRNHRRQGGRMITGNIAWNVGGDITWRLAWYQTGCFTDTMKIVLAWVFGVGACSWDITHTVKCFSCSVITSVASLLPIHGCIATRCFWFSNEVAVDTIQDLQCRCKRDRMRIKSLQTKSIISHMTYTRRAPRE